MSSEFNEIIKLRTLHEGSSYPSNERTILLFLMLTNCFGLTLSILSSIFVCVQKHPDKFCILQISIILLGLPLCRRNASEHILRQITFSLI